MNDTFTALKSCLHTMSRPLAQHPLGRSQLRQLTDLQASLSSERKQNLQDSFHSIAEVHANVERLLPQLKLKMQALQV